MPRSLELLAERILRLDARFQGEEDDLDRDVCHFVGTISIAAPTGSLPTPIAADRADEIVNQSSLLERLQERAPAVTVGPVPRTQYWIATGRPSWVPSRAYRIDREHFVDARSLAHTPASTKPFGVGLYTSSPLLGAPGMWWLYLVESQDMLFPRPWQVWSLVVDHHADVLEITTAEEWVRMVSEHPLQRGGLLYPDWKSVSRQWAGIHMTLRAIASTQGISFLVGNRVAAPLYWDVESTLWLEWAFADVSRVEAPEAN